MDFELSKPESRDEIHPVSEKLFPAIVASLFFHGLLAAVFLNGQVGGQKAERKAIKPAIISVRLLPQNPQTPQVSESVLSLQQSEVPISIELDDSSSVELLVEDRSIDSNDASNFNSTNDRESDSLPESPNNDLVGLQPAEASTDLEGVTAEEAQGIPFPEISLPSVLMVQESVHNIDTQRRTRFYSHRCNPLEEEAGIRNCESPQQRELQSSSYQLEQRNSTYRALNPIREFSRTERSSAVVATESKALAGRLSNLRVPDGLSDYVLEELEAGITHNADLGNRAVEHMLNSNDKSAAGAIARALLSDPVVVKKSKELQRRKVHLPN